MVEKRIYVQEVKNAYKSTGLKPISCSTYENRNGQQCACAIAALAISKGVWNPQMKEVEVFEWADSEYGDDYVAGFVEGFDGYDKYFDEYTPKNFKRGFEHGKKVRECVLK